MLYIQTGSHKVPPVARISRVATRADDEGGGGGGGGGVH